MIRKIIHWYSEKEGVAKYLIEALIPLVIFYGGAILKFRIDALIEDDRLHEILLEAGAVFIIVFIYVLFIRYVNQVIQDQIKEENTRKRQLMYAYSQMDNLVSTQIYELKKYAMSDNEKRLAIFKSCMNNIQRIISNAYNFFECNFGESEKMNERIDFEVTFMTRSYIDNYITIPASANRKGRAPVSMQERDKNNEIYENTITSEIYKQLRHEMRIIPSTEGINVAYNELYPGQKNRIKSSIIHPVKDDVNEMLGALVVHCNKEKFFDHNDHDFWEELLDIYAVRLAFEKAKLDYYSNDEIQDELGIEWHAPF